MDIADLRNLRHQLDDAFAVVGSTDKAPIPSEEPARRFARRSLVTARDLPAGHVVIAADLTWKRPATGISPADFDRVIGMRTREAIPEDTILEWGHVE